MPVRFDLVCGPAKVDLSFFRHLVAKALIDDVSRIAWMVPAGVQWAIRIVSPSLDWG